MRAGERGFTYVWLLAVVAVLGLSLAAVGGMWSEDAKRAKEQELLRIGALYAHAIDRYRNGSPGMLRQYPPSIDALLLDTRFVGTRRHLRKAYTDPLAPGKPWGLIKDQDDRVMGVYSTSGEQPLRVEPLDLGVTQLPAARRYSDWKFIPKAQP